MIDVQDCDARLPSSGDSNDLYLDELMRLSVISGRVLKTIYGYALLFGLLLVLSVFCFSPSGLKHATDEAIQKLLSDLESWKENLPEQLRFRGPSTSRSGGLFLISVPVHLN